MSPRLFSVSLVVLLSGCDPFYGVESHAKITGRIDVRCINDALASVPDVGRVAYQPSKESGYVWLYGEAGRDILQIYRDSDVWDYSNSRRRMGVAVPHSEMARFIPLMQKVNGAIQTRCRLPVATLKPEPVGETESQEL